MSVNKANTSQAGKEWVKNNPDQTTAGQHKLSGNNNNNNNQQNSSARNSDQDPKVGSKQDGPMIGKGKAENKNDKHEPVDWDDPVAKKDSDANMKTVTHSGQFEDIANQTRIENEKIKKQQPAAQNGQNRGQENNNSKNSNNNSGNKQSSPSTSSKGKDTPKDKEMNQQYAKTGHPQAGAQQSTPGATTTSRPQGKAAL